MSANEPAKAMPTGTDIEPTRGMLGERERSSLFPPAEQALPADTSAPTEASPAESAKVEQLERRLKERFDEIATLTRLLQDKSEIAALIKRLHERETELTKRLRDQEAELTRRLHDREKVIAALRGELKTRDAVGGRAAAAFGQALTALLNNLGRWPFLPKRYRLRRQTALLRRSGVVDAAFYLRRYPDVASAGMNPVRHYLTHGALEGREPNPTFAQAGAEVSGDDAS